MITFDGIGRVDQPSNFFREIKNGGQLLPIVFPQGYWGGVPGFDRSPILASPLFFQLKQVCFSLFASGCLVDGFEICSESLAVLPNHIFQAGPNLMDDTALGFGFWKNSLDRIRKSRQPVDRSYENILNAPVLQVSDHGKPEISSFTSDMFFFIP